MIFLVRGQSLTQYNGHAYKLYNIAATYDSAKATCDNSDGYLVEITSTGENNFIKGLANGIRVWLGATDQEQEGSWKWSRGSSVSYFNWATGEPNGGEDEDCITQEADGQWVDRTCTTTHIFICEWDTGDQVVSQGDGCDSNPCYAEGGICENLAGGGWKCNCNDGYTHRTAATAPQISDVKDPCIGIVCSNGGHCTIHSTEPPQFLCECPMGYATQPTPNTPGTTECVENGELN